MSLEDILPGLNNPDPETRKEVVRELVRQRAFETADILRQVAAKDPDAEVRTLAAGAVAFFEREPVRPDRRDQPRRPPTAPPDISDIALLRKEIRARRGETSLMEYALMGFLLLLFTAILVILIINGIKAVRDGGAEVNQPVTERGAIVAEMRQAIDTARAAADQLAALPGLVGSTPGGVGCDALPDIPAIYRRTDAELNAYPELGPPQWALNRAYINIHDAQRRWRQYCQERGSLTDTPDYLVGHAEQMIEGGRKDLDEAASRLDDIAPE
ncbi:MAG: HEAT repeat domain-containing protein [Anaerolineae bacterium]|nr:HEAT repeat domain-containing protein [Anaerolineae bacterium]